MNKLPDIQEQTMPDIPRSVHRVGVSNIKFPIIISDGGLHENVQASVSIFICLKHNIRAISMSELFRSLRKYAYKDINISALESLLKEFKKASKEPSHTASITFNFDYSKIQMTPKSNIAFPMYYPCILKGELMGGMFRLYKGVTVPYTSYCPCSKSLVDNVGFGISHNQRSFCDFFVELDTDHDMKYSQLISIIEKSVVNRIYPVLRRADEQFIAMVAESNQYFVEDSIRRITSKIDSYKNIEDWAVRVRHEESIHQHDAVAMCFKGNISGMDEQIFMNWRK